MKKLSILVIIAVILFFAGSAMAGVEILNDGTTYKYWLSGNSDLSDLAHEYAYFWGLDLDYAYNSDDLPTLKSLLDDGWYISGASLFFDNIRDWTWEKNDLYVTLIDQSNSSLVGLTSYWDNQNSGDYFDSWGGIELVQYEDLPAFAQDLTYTFDATELSALASYSADGYFGIGFDPDCHYYNDGIKLYIEITQGGTAVPEPATMILFGTGLVALGGVARKRLQKKQG